jgi:glycosyltransferase involved in cell wall biosynthesis
VRIGDRVHFVGAVPDLVSLMQRADAFWSCGYADDVPLAVAESRVFGLPVIASNTPAHRALVPSGGHDHLYPTGDRAALARATIRLLQSDNLRRRNPTSSTVVSRHSPTSLPVLANGSHPPGCYADVYASLC